MACGCSKRGASVLPKVHEANTARKTTQVAVYQVIKDGATVVETTSPTAAREESRRLGASIRVSSRPLEAETPVPA